MEGLPVGIAGSSLTLIFTISTGVNKSLLRVTKKRKKKHNKIIALAKSKLNTIDTLLSTALNYSKISHEEFSNIITEKSMCENIKENMKDMTESSSLEHIKEEKNSTIESSSLKLTTLQKSFKILIIFKILFILIKKQITCKALRSKELGSTVMSAAFIKHEKRNLLFSM